MFCLLACNKRCLQLLNTWSQALAEYINVTRTKTCLELLCLPFQSIAITRSYQYRRIAQNSSWNQRLENLSCSDLVKKLNFCQLLPPRRPCGGPRPCPPSSLIYCSSSTYKHLARCRWISFNIHESSTSHEQGCISCGILVSGIWARGVSLEHMENMEMFSCSPT